MTADSLTAPAARTPAAQLPDSRTSQAGAPDSRTPAAQAPDAQAPDSRTPAAQAPAAQAPETQAPETQAPDTRAPDTRAPDTRAPAAQAPDSRTPQAGAPVARNSGGAGGLRDLLPARLRRSWAVDGTCPDLDLYSLFRARQIAELHRTAVVDSKGKLCYTALDRKVRCLATGLRELGIREGDVVGVQLPDNRNAVITDLALAALGAVALPFPAGRCAEEAASLLRRAEAVAVVAATEHRDAHPAADLLALAPQLPALRHVVAAGPGTAPEGAVAFARLLRADPADFVAARPDPDSAARILVSSGSEAEPKMIAYSHNALAGGRGNFLASLIPDATPPRCLFLVPLASAFGSNGTAVTLARHGGTLVLLDRFTPEAALAAIRDHEPTHVLGVPTMIRMMLDRLDTTGDAPGDAPGDEPRHALGDAPGDQPRHAAGDAPGAAPRHTHVAVPGARLPAPVALVLGGAPLDETTAADAAAAFGCPVVNLYGSADGVNCHTGLENRTPPTDGTGVVAGRPDPRVAEIRIADTETHAPLPDGAVGEIVARGPMTPLCYVGAPELDARYRTADGWVRTGDLGFLDPDGILHVVGRLKDIVIRGGVNISPAEVERALASHPGIRDVVCVGVPDDLMGERLAACVVPRAEVPAGQALALGSLGAHLTASGLEPRKHPERLLTVAELPLTPAGKPDRAALRARLVTAGEDVRAAAG
ncbi:class I adenylate-forming enzyme family protein [Streptomyces sp. NPDC047981]|uniref:class I adenylate-forming enzyme family protein n=1 Tax=Streptomyces sp. NPDC047981 TaxID=3154610 RepID=UPI003436C6C0